MSSRKKDPAPSQRRTTARRTKEHSSLIAKERKKVEKRSTQDNSTLDDRFHRTFKVTGQASDTVMVPDLEE